MVIPTHLQVKHVTMVHGNCLVRHKKQFLKHIVLSPQVYCIKYQWTKDLLPVLNILFLEVWGMAEGRMEQGTVVPYYYPSRGCYGKEKTRADGGC